MALCAVSFTAIPMFHDFYLLSLAALLLFAIPVFTANVTIEKEA